jgi:2-(1,2-epoxy-1,2-dihydrophenyl)acetyl-CoA isomerase
MDTIELTVDNGAATILLNRPEALNAWNRQFGLDLLEAVRTVADDDAVRSVVVRGAGRAFSSGADLKDMGEQAAEAGDGATVDVQSMLRDRYHPIITGLRTMPKPVIAAVHGPAVGIGCSLALAADLIVAAESAYFLLAFVNIGLVPDGGSSVFIPTRVGMARAAEMAMLGERVPARQALEWGLVNRVVADDDFDAEVAALARRLADGPTRSYAGSKRQLNHWLYGRMEEQLELEASIQQEMAQTGDFAEGVTAFIQKRSPDFRGA